MKAEQIITFCNRFDISVRATILSKQNDTPTTQQQTHNKQPTTQYTHKGFHHKQKEKKPHIITNLCVFFFFNTFSFVMSSLESKTPSTANNTNQADQSNTCNSTKVNAQGKRICCACPETKEKRDQCVIKNGFVDSPAVGSPAVGSSSSSFS